MTYVINTHRLPGPAMAIAIEPQGRIASAEAADLLRGRFVMVLAATHPERIVVDFSAVPEISEAGVDALRKGRDKATAERASVEVLHAAPQVHEKLRRHGLAELVDEPA
ncbi:STAS domain-containing protein [Paractinoplanes atraurantiacus]|uniref:STAS domain-containing protein n=1 Tax=Paractinoplanes atraurantiacus TaxID=1036182 RepID=A0A285GPI0_9ACTN|nr:STAS domain-containing protein [Actinoplanes atraurantiacus]SNY25447.1 STAS domain-containing protein [Actinoplanes atraurantiacus]